MDDKKMTILELGRTIKINSARILERARKLDIKVESIHDKITLEQSRKIKTIIIVDEIAQQLNIKSKNLKKKLAKERPEIDISKNFVTSNIAKKIIEYMKKTTIDEFSSLKNTNISKKQEFTLVEISEKIGIDLADINHRAWALKIEVKSSKTLLTNKQIERIDKHIMLYEIARELKIKSKRLKANILEMKLNIDISQDIVTKEEGKKIKKIFLNNNSISVKISEENKINSEKLIDKKIDTNIQENKVSNSLKLSTTNKKNPPKNINILVNINEDNYINDSYTNLSEELNSLFNKETSIEEYFKEISDDYSSWGIPLYISNISLDKEKPYLLIRPKIRPKLLKYFPENFIIGFKVSPKINETTGHYYPLFINEFIQLVSDDYKREWEIEINCNIFNTTNQLRDNTVKYLSKNFVDKLPLPSIQTKEKLKLWYEYLEWKYHADISVSDFYIITEKKENGDYYQLKLEEKLSKYIREEINEYGVYLFSEKDVQITKHEDKKKVKLIYKNEKSLIGEVKKFHGKQQYILDSYIEGFTKEKEQRFSYDINSNFFKINIKNIKDFTDKKYIIFIKKQDRYTNTKLISNIDQFKVQGGYSPFLSSYLFDIKKARTPSQLTKLSFHDKNLTDEQKRAVQVMYDSPDIALIQGPPGTGKTTIIAECIYQYVKEDKKVLLTSESNDAVDNALERLFDLAEIIPLRLTGYHRSKNSQNNSKFSKDEVTKTYFQDIISQPSKDILFNFKKIEDEYISSKNIYEKINSLYKRVTQEKIRFDDIENSLKNLNNEKKKLEKKNEEAIKINKQLENFQLLNDLIKKNNINLTIGEQHSIVIDNFIEYVYKKISIKSDYFNQYIENENKSAYVKSKYIEDGLQKYLYIKNILIEAKKDFIFLKNLSGNKIITEDVQNKIEEIQYKIDDARKDANKKEYDKYNTELSKLSREKGLNLDNYFVDNSISFIFEYFINYEKKKIQSILTHAEKILNKQKERDSLLKILNKSESYINDKKRDLTISLDKQKQINVEFTQQEEKLSDIKNKIKKSKLKCNKEIKKIITLKNEISLEDIEVLLDSNILNLRAILSEYQLSEKELSNKCNDQKNMKVLQKLLNELQSSQNQIKKTTNIVKEKNIQIKNAEQFIREKEKEIVKINIKINQNEKLISNINKEENFLKKVKNKLFHNPTKLSSDIVTLKNEIQTITKSIESKKNDINSLKTDISDLNIQKNINENDVSNISNKIKKIKLFEYNQITNDLNLNNVNKVIKELSTHIISDEELDYIKQTQKNITEILNILNALEPNYIEYSELLKEYDQIDSVFKNTQKEMKKIDSKIQKFNNDIKVTEEDMASNQKLLNEEFYFKYNQESLTKRIKTLKEKVKSLSKEHRSEEQREYVENKIGSNASKKVAMEYLSFFINDIENIIEKTDDILESFLDITKNDMKKITIDKVNENDIIKINNNIIKNSITKENLQKNIDHLNHRIDEILDTLNFDTKDIDSILKELKEKQDNSQLSTNELIIKPLVENWVNTIKIHKPTDREEQIYFDNVNVVGITLNASEDLLKNINLEYFDVVIIDEISKATPPEYLSGMMRAKKAILVGDHRQLPPLFQYHDQDFSFEDAIHEEESNEVISLENYNKYKKMVTASQFQEFFIKANEKIKYRLTKQFRMHTDIMDIVNCFYGGQLKQGISKNKEEHNKEKSHNIFIQNFIAKKDHAVWVDTSKKFGEERNCQVQKETSKKNPFEAFLTIEALKKIDKYLYDTYKDDKIHEKLTIGVISFYKGQVDLLNNKLKELDLKYFDKNKQDEIMISTVDSFQGRDRDIILVDLISTRQKVGKNNFVSSFQRINVAFSRAKRLLVIFGSKEVFDNYEVEIPDIQDETILKKEKVYGKITRLIQKKGAGKLPSDIVDFNTWNTEKVKYE